MGVHARRAARRTTPMVAVAAGIGTVAAMLASPTAVHAADTNPFGKLVLDPAYGSRTGAVFAGAIDTSSPGGLVPTRGVDAVDAPDGTRVVLGQERGGQRRVTLTRFRADGAAVDNTFPHGGQAVFGPSGAPLPVPTTSLDVSRLLFDGTNFWVIGETVDGTNLVVFQVVGTTGELAVGTPVVVPITSLGLLPGSTISIVDVTLARRAVPALPSVPGVAVGLNVTSGASKGTRVVRVESTGLDLAFNGTGYWTVPGGLTLGGITTVPTSLLEPILTSDAVAGTFQGASADGTEASGKSGVFLVDGAGLPGPGFGTAGISYAINDYAEATAPDGASSQDKGGRWTTEVLGDLVAPSTLLIPPLKIYVSGRVGSRTFLASINTLTGALDTAAFGPQGGIVPSPTGGGGLTTVGTTCTGGQSQVAPIPDPVIGIPVGFYVSNVCADGKAELVRMFANGMLDTGFNAGSAVWKPDLSVNARPFGVTATGKWRMGSARPDGSDAATAQLTSAVAPDGPTVEATTATTVPAGQSVTLVAWPASKEAIPTAMFRWERRGNAALSWVPVQNSPTETISGNNSRSLRISTSGSMDGYQYRVVAVNTAGESASSDESVITLHVLPIAPAITKQPASQSAPVDGSVTFSAEATGDPTPTWSWQWQAPGSQEWSDVLGGPNIEGVKTSTLKIKNIAKEWAGNHYRAIAANDADSVKTDGKATLSIGAPGHGPGPGPVPGHHTWGDYDGDGKTDIATFTPSTGAFNWMGEESRAFGKRGDLPVVGNYDDDPVDDAAVYRRSNGTWYIDGEAPVAFGRSTDTPLSADFDGDGENDIAVYRPSNGTWYVKGMAPVAFGRSTDIPVPADYNGDGQDEIAVYRPSNGTWYVKGMSPVAFGRSTDIPVWGDFDGHGAIDFALFRPSNATWYVRGSAPVAFGRGTDVPLSGDFNGDGKTDIATYRPSDHTWNFLGGDPVDFGSTGDWPLPH